MLVHAPRVELTDEEAVLVAELEPDRDRERAGGLRLGVERAYRDWMDDETGTPSVPVAAVLATALGEDLRFEAPISPRLRHGAEQVSRRFAGWWGYRPVRIEAPDADPGAPAPEVAALFSGGVDTTATLLRSLRGEIPERATHLLGMYGSEWKLSPATHAEIWRENAEAAAAYGLPLIRMTTNAPELLRGRIGWPRSHGASFASLALSLGPRFGAVLFGSSQRPQEGRPHGSRADLDYLWSTESTRVVHDGAELGKLGRAALVATDPVAMAHLRVCWARDGAGNCGRCEKCLRTMTCLAAAGALDRTDRFDAPLTVEAIRACRPSPNSSSLIRELVDDLPAEHAELRSAWDDKLREAMATERAERRRRALRPWRRRWRRARRRAGRPVRLGGRRLGGRRGPLA
jgi:hypothetical protein